MELPVWGRHDAAGVSMRQQGPTMRLQARCLFVYSTLRLAIPFTITTKLLYDKDGNSTWTTSTSVSSAGVQIITARARTFDPCYLPCRGRTTWQATPRCRLWSRSRLPLGFQVIYARWSMKPVQLSSCLASLLPLSSSFATNRSTPRMQWACRYSPTAPQQTACRCQAAEACACY